MASTSMDAFSLPGPGLSGPHREQFFLGNSFFNQNWIVAPASTTSRDGLGPLFTARSCSGCHFKDGRGAPPAGDDAPVGLLLRLGSGERGERGAPSGHVHYGDQLDLKAVPGVQPEARVRVRYERVALRFESGEPIELLRPRYELDDFSDGPLGPEARLSARVAPALLGVGRLASVLEEELAALEDPNDSDGDGISGRSNWVWDRATQRPARGRFGWKAEQPTLKQQAAGAFQGDMGLTSALFPEDGLTAGQRDDIRVPSGGEPEVDAEVLEAVTLYLHALAVPARRHPAAGEVVQGEQLFAQLGCASCHRPRLRTGVDARLPELGLEAISAFTDLLLHDMGPELSDDRPAFSAEGVEWRTPPLWGLGLIQAVNGHQRLLHDGRARGVSEAILWHGGEAAPARDEFRHLGLDDRRALVAFVNSL